ncbi:MAG: MBL fold metallo-hydrolase [Clostridiales bacterium]|nr:MBL fold metallo-hydrolase [Clostridiales bacterium]
MDLTFCAIASGSSGNSYMVRSDETVLLVDAGISGKRIKEGLEKGGASLDAVDAILVTHEHSDHVRSLGIMQRKCPGAQVWSNIGTFRRISGDVEDGRHSTFTTGEAFRIGDITVDPFPVSHDAAEPVGFVFRKGDSRIAIVTDTGYVSDEIFEAIVGSDLVILEANHDENVLRYCRYPFHIKQRILSDHGHLCNEAAADCIERLLRESDKLPVILLAHLSKENNTPDMALITVRNALEASDAFAAREESLRDLRLEVLSRSEPGKVYQIG